MRKPSGCITNLNYFEKRQLAIIVTKPYRCNASSFPLHMCGIFAYVGNKKNAADIVLEGLKMLEYRGYDSWGVAAKKETGTLFIKKRVGKIGNSTLPQFSSHISIGHTRWATHGGVTKQNAHPHTDCTGQIAVLHNGIIENFAQLREKLQKKGHIFISQTDTEVAAHLIEENLKTHNFITSVKRAFSLLTGMNAVVVLNNITSQVVAVKNGSPLVVGVGEKEFYLASDAIGIVKHTKNVVFLEDNQMAILGENLKITDSISGQTITPHMTAIDWEFEHSDRGKYKHFYIKEIHEEARVIEHIGLHSLSSTKKLSEMIKKSYGTFLIACGSASYAAIGATYLFSKIAKRHVNYAIGSEFKYSENFVTTKTLVIPVSQSGESIDVIEPITRLKKGGVKIAAIVNVLGSTLYRLADLNVMLESGPEKAVVATKSFVAMLATLILTSYTITGKQKAGQEILLKASNNISSILSDSSIKKIKTIAKKIAKHDNVYIIGRGLSYTAALEAALKLKESAYIHAEAFPGGELKHGVIALIEKGTACIVFAPNDETYSEIISNAQEVKARGGYILGIGPKNNTVFDDYLPTADIKEGTLLSQVATSHLLSYFVALERGIKDPDKPRNLAKSVTVK